MRAVKRSRNSGSVHRRVSHDSRNRRANAMRSVNSRRRGVPVCAPRSRRFAGVATIVLVPASLHVDARPHFGDAGHLRQPDGLVPLLSVAYDAPEDDDPIGVDLDGHSGVRIRAAAAEKTPITQAILDPRSEKIGARLHGDGLAGDEGLFWPRTSALRRLRRSWLLGLAAGDPRRAPPVRLRNGRGGGFRRAWGELRGGLVQWLDARTGFGRSAFVGNDRLGGPGRCWPRHLVPTGRGLRARGRACPGSRECRKTLPALARDAWRRLVGGSVG